MKKRVYIETTIPSFYFETRPQPEMVARRNWTRQWWDHHAHTYEIVTSPAVLAELEDGDYPHREEALSLLSDVLVIPIENEVLEIIEAYVAHKVMPRDPMGDAAHLALATFHRCEFLLTWNCNHLANANKFGHIRRINTILGFMVPALVTPLER